MFSTYFAGIFYISYVMDYVDSIEFFLRIFRILVVFYFGSVRISALSLRTPTVSERFVGPLWGKMM